MSNMSYCRYRNTLSDLRDCMSAASDTYDSGEKDVTPEEVTAFRIMVREFYDFMNDYCFIDGEGTFDDNELDEFCNAIQRE